MAASRRGRLDIGTRILAQGRAPLVLFRKRRAVQPDCVGVLFDEHAREDAAGQLAEIARFDRLKVAAIDLRFFGQTVQIDARS